MAPAFFQPLLPTRFAAFPCSRPSHTHFGPIIQVLYLGIDSLVWDQLSQLASEPQLTMTSVLCDFISDVWMRDPAAQRHPLDCWPSWPKKYLGPQGLITVTRRPCCLHFWNAHPVICVGKWVSSKYIWAVLLQPQGLVSYSATLKRKTNLTPKAVKKQCNFFFPLKVLGEMAKGNIYHITQRKAF